MPSYIKLGCIKTSTQTNHRACSTFTVKLYPLTTRFHPLSKPYARPATLPTIKVTLHSYFLDISLYAAYTPH